MRTRRHVELMGALLAVLLATVATASYAVIETYEFSNPVLEARYHRLSQELRCPKCQNQNIADSNAPISEDLRRLLFEKLEAGASDEEILDDLVSRYGEFVRYRPSASGATLALWLTPAVLLVAGLLILMLMLRRARPATVAELNASEREQLASMLEKERERP